MEYLQTRFDEIQNFARALFTQRPYPPPFGDVPPTLQNVKFCQTLPALCFTMLYLPSRSPVSPAINSGS
jgi:hypothetical protein